VDIFQQAAVAVIVTMMYILSTDHQGSLKAAYEAAFSILPFRLAAIYVLK
jgi:hypothetical protein